MDTLPRLLIQNQNNLERLRMRMRYCDRSLAEIDNDFSRLYGPLAREWERCHDELASLREDVREDVLNTAQFLLELRAFTVLASQRKRITKRFTEATIAMIDLSNEALVCQSDMLKEADERISLHRDYSEQLKLMESVDETH